LLEKSDIIILILDASRPISDEDTRLLELTEKKNRIIVLNKVDLPGRAVITKELKHIIETSAKTGYGIDKLKEEIKKRVKDLINIDSGDRLFFTTRQILALKKLQSVITECINFILTQSPAIDIVSTLLHSGIKICQEITGDITNDEIINGIFKNFCIGK